MDSDTDAFMASINYQLLGTQVEEEISFAPPKPFYQLGRLGLLISTHS